MFGNTDRDESEVLKYLVEVRLKKEGDFLKVKETLTRIGLASRNTLCQTCHILHKRGKYYCVHFKEIFLLDGKESTIDKTDIARRNTIAFLLDEWGLFEVVDKNKIVDRLPVSSLKIIPFREKDNWILQAKYTIGKGKAKK